MTCNLVSFDAACSMGMMSGGNVLQKYKVAYDVIVPLPQIHSRKISKLVRNNELLETGQGRGSVPFKLEHMLKGTNGWVVLRGSWG